MSALAEKGDSPVDKSRVSGGGQGVPDSEGRDTQRGMTARVLTSPMIIDRVTPTVSTADAHGDSSLPSGGSSNSQEPEMLLCGRRCTTSNTSTTTQDSLQQVTRIRNVARNLFGVPPPTTAQYARDKLREIRKKDAQRWNFDFEKEKPLPGR